MPLTYTASFMLSLCVQTKGEASTKDKDRLERLLLHHACNGLAIEVRLYHQSPFCIASLTLLHSLTYPSAFTHPPVSLPPSHCLCPHHQLTLVSFVIQQLSTRAAHTAHHRKIALAVAHMDMIQAKFRWDHALIHSYTGALIHWYTDALVH